MKKILLLEDSPEYQFVLNALFHSRKIDLCAFARYQDAIKNLASTSFDLALIDYLLDEKNGLQFIEVLRQDARNKNIPVFLLTTKNLNEQELERVNQLQVIYIQKPLAPEELLRRALNTLSADGGRA